MREIEDRYAPQLARLREVLKRVHEEGRELIARAESRCTEFRLATGELYSFRLFAPEIGGWSRGRPLGAVPKGGKGVFRFGFDPHGALIYADHAYPRRGGYVEAVLEDLIYRVNKLSGRVEAVGETMITENRRAELRVVASPARWIVNEYAGEHDRYRTLIEATGKGERRTFDLTYDETGALASIEWKEHQHVVWRRESRPTTNVFAWIKDELVRQITERLPRVAGERATYALALAYRGSGDTPILPPELAIGFVDERDRALREDPKYGREAIWDPRLMYGPMREEDDPALILDDPRLLKAADDLDFTDERVAPRAAKTLLAVSKALNESALFGVQRAPEFVVYAADLDRGDWEGDIERSAGKKRVASLRRAGLIAAKTKSR